MSFAIAAPVKMVIWDLDDTFWQGTLSEEPIVPIARNIEMVRVLAARGIVSAICSNNEAAAVEAQLAALGLDAWFVAPRAAFRRKGAPIADLIATLRLRPENCVFIDDNPAVLAEAVMASPGLTGLSHPDELAAAMDGPWLAGSPDPQLLRLAQYRQLAARQDERAGHDAGEESFLRQSGIRVAIDYDVEPHFERVVDLVNRSNQLNFTKIRLPDEAAQAELRGKLAGFGYKAGIVRAWDRYADYGIVGFFLTLATLREYRAEHFVFSCRIMHMGIEQYVWEFLNRPEIAVVEPVANPVAPFAAVDWIAAGEAGQVPAAPLKDRALVLIGGCDMLQLSTYCSASSAEFTNRDVGGIIKRLDDPLLILDNPDAVARSELRPQVPAFSHAEMLELREAVARADGVIVSFYRMMEINYFKGRDGLVARFDEDAVRQILASDKGVWFVRNFAFLELAHEQRQQLVRLSLEALARMARPGCPIVVILENTRKLDHNPDERRLREMYNAMIRELCGSVPALACVDINAVTSPEFLFDDGFHMRRQGYFELAQAVRAVLSA